MLSVSEFHDNGKLLCRETIIQEAISHVGLPLLMDWGFYFPSDGNIEALRQERLKMMRKFTAFWDRRNIEKKDVKCRCVIGGRAYGIAGYSKGIEVIVKGVKSIQRIAYDGNEKKPMDVLKVYASAEDLSEMHEFYLFSDSICHETLNMVSDIHRCGKLSNRKGYYLPMHIRDIYGEQYL